ncbi:hypothetical protein [Saccharopolyspora taberi]
MASAVVRCELCELPVGQCPHTRPAQPAPSRAHHQILVSPSGTAHVPGCMHNTESRFDEWGEIRDVPNAWERIKTGQAIQANAGADRSRVATKVCSTCG